MSKSTTITVALDEDAYASSRTHPKSYQRRASVCPRANWSRHVNAEMSRLSARKIAQRFLKSIMKQIGALSGQILDEEEDDTIPSISLEGRMNLPSSKNPQPARSRGRCGRNTAR